MTLARRVSPLSGRWRRWIANLRGGPLLIQEQETVVRSLRESMCKKLRAGTFVPIHAGKRGGHQRLPRYFVLSFAAPPPAPRRP